MGTMKGIVFAAVSMCLWVSSALSEVIEYRCVTPIEGKDVVMHIVLDTDQRTVRQTFDLGRGSVVLDYLDKAVKQVVTQGPTALSVPIEHFVRFNSDIIYYGTILKQVEQGTTIDRRTGAMVLPIGGRGHCMPLPR